MIQLQSPWFRAPTQGKQSKPLIEMLPEDVSPETYVLMTGAGAGPTESEMCKRVEKYRPIKNIYF